MNLSHIENENFQKEIKDFWREWKNEKGNYEDVGLWWDIGKTYIKRIAIEFSIKKQKENYAKKRRRKKIYVLNANNHNETGKKLLN